MARLAGDAGDEATVADVLQTLRARPATLPQTAEELSATQTAARVQIATLLEDDAPERIDLIVGAGRTIGLAPHPGQAARILLDGVRPLGVTQLGVDVASLLGPLGSLPDDEIREGLTLLGDDIVVPLGTAIVCRGGEARSGGDAGHRAPLRMAEPPRRSRSATASSRSFPSHEARRRR